MLASSRKWEPGQQHLGDLGLAGICLEILRVLLAILPGFDSEGHALLLVAHVGVCAIFFNPLLSGGVSTLLRLVFSRTFFLVLLDLMCVAIYGCLFSLSVTTLYRTKGAVRVAAMNLVTKDMRTQYNSTFFMAAAILGGCVAASGDAWRALRLLQASGEIVVALQLLGGAACLAGTAYIALVCQLACVVSLLEDASSLGAMRRSCALLAGSNFWRAAPVFAVLDACFVAALMTFPAVRIGGAVITMALCAVLVVVTLVAQPVVYRVLCDSAAKNYQYSSTMQLPRTTRKPTRTNHVMV
ncbi:hypothetical protein ACQ4PT_046838 [Festuca glaucescens]